MKLRSWRGSSPGVICRRLNLVGLQDRPRDGGSSAGAPENFSIVQSGVLVGNAHRAIEAFLHRQAGGFNRIGNKIELPPMGQRRVRVEAALGFQTQDRVQVESGREGTMQVGRLSRPDSKASVVLGEIVLEKSIGLVLAFNPL